MANETVEQQAARRAVIKNRLRENYWIDFEGEDLSIREIFGLEEVVPKQLQL
jgi:hypothetical protein